MTQLELFQAFVAPAIFISATGLLVLSINARLMGIVTRLRLFHREKHLATLAGKKQEALILQAQIESIQHRAGKIKNAFFYLLLGGIGTMNTCLLLGMIFYISEVAIGLSSEKEEEQLYELIDAISELSGEDGR